MAKCHIAVAPGANYTALCRSDIEIMWVADYCVFKLVRCDNQCKACKCKYDRRVRKESSK